MTSPYKHSEEEQNKAKQVAGARTPPGKSMKSYEKLWMLIFREG